MQVTCPQCKNQDNMRTGCDACDGTGFIEHEGPLPHEVEPAETPLELTQEVPVPELALAKILDANDPTLQTAARMRAHVPALKDVPLPDLALAIHWMRTNVVFHGRALPQGDVGKALFLTNEGEIHSYGPGMTQAFAADVASQRREGAIYVRAATVVLPQEATVKYEPSGD